MTVKEIMSFLESKGNPGTKKVLLKHGMKEPFFGVKVGDMKVIQKKIKKEYQLALDLYATGNADAMYLAGLIADETKMTKKDLETWIKQATSSNIIEYTIPWLSAETKFGMELGLKWIEDKNPDTASAGWATLSSVVSITPDPDLDLKVFKTLLQRVQKEIHKSENRVRSKMNGFIIAVGSWVPALTEDALAAAKKIGEVYVDVGDTSCKVPDALEYIAKVKAKGSLGKKKKMARC
ncbi:DNA alkylation repair protein [Sphingobacteriaceae bacterium]|nr:DNA alkylation repair protein [Sphingobacteriaceae bacterium]